MSRGKLVTLLEKQFLFSKLLGQFLTWCADNGHQVTMGECYRTPEQAALNANKGSGIQNSLHTLRLAVDLNPFVNGVYQTDGAAYRVLGDYWKTLDTQCCFGGDFHPKPDNDHFSISHNGIK